MHIINVKVAKQQRVKHLAAQIGSLRYSASRFRTYYPGESDEETAAFSKIDDKTSRSEHKLCIDMKVLWEPVFSRLPVAPPL